LCPLQLPLTIITSLWPSSSFKLNGKTRRRSEKLQQFDLIGRLRENDTISQADELRILLASASEDSKLYDAEIFALYNRIDELQAEKTALQRQIAVGRSFLSPVRRLPAGILSEIFQFVLAVLKIGLVCTAWKAVFLRTVEVWVQIIADLSELEGTRPRIQKLDILEAEALSRRLVSLTRGASLTLTFINSDEKLQIWAAALNHCQKTAIICPAAADRAGLERHLKALPNLQDCRLYISGSWFGPAIDVSLSMPKVRRLAIVVLSTNIILPKHKTSLDLSYSQYSPLLDALTHTPLLEILTISNMRSGAMERVAGPCIHLIKHTWI